MPGYEDRLRHMRRHAGRQAMEENVRRRMERRHAQQLPPRIPSFAEIVAANNFIRVYYDLKLKNGHAPGPDGVTFPNLSRREVCNIMRAVEQELRNGTYRASRSREVRIRKPSGGYRVLQLRSIVHRVVAAALNDALAPYWESIYLDCSYGFRRARNVWHVLAAIEYAVEVLHYYVICQDDIRQAFDHVRLDAVMAAHRQFIHDEELLGLVDMVLRDPHRQNHMVGIDQGNPYSPTALNVLLHVHLDVPITTCGEFPSRRYRYADNLLAATREVSEGWSFLDHIRQHLQPLGLSLKGADGPPVDLRQQGTEVTILGLVITLVGERIHYGIPETNWLDLEEGLLAVHGNPSPTRLVREIIRGWVEARGPAFEEAWDPVVERILSTAARHGYREIAYKEVRGWIQSSRDRWRHQRDQVRQRLSGGPVGTRSPTLADATGHHVMSEAGSAGTVPADLGCPFFTVQNNQKGK